MHTEPISPVIEWIPVAAWWVPIWVELHGESTPPNPLRRAVEALVQAGRVDIGAMAQDLCLSPAMVRAVVQEACKDGVLRVDEHQRVFCLVEGPDAEPVPEAATVHAREAWAAWDPLHQRLLPSIWLGARFPHAEVPSGEEAGARPDPGRLRDALRLLPQLPTLTLLTLRASADGRPAREAPTVEQLRTLDAARLRSVRLRDGGRAKRGGIVVPTEVRYRQVVVWRPAVVADPRELGALDPRGQAGLELRAARIAELLRRRLDMVADEHLGPLLAKQGFSSLEEVRQAAHHDLRQKLGDQWQPERWPMTVLRLEDAFLDERIGSLLDGDWRRLARGWADVMEDFTHELTEPARRLVLERNIREVALLPPETEQHLKSLFVSQGARAIKQLRHPKEGANDWKSLHNKLKNDADSIGHRLAALAVAAWVDPAVRRAVERAAEALPGAVSHLEAATQERNTVIHRRTRAEDVDVQGFRDRILRLVGAWMVSGIRV